MKRDSEAYALFIRELKTVKNDLRSAFKKRDVLKTISMAKFLTYGYYELDYTYRDDEIEHIVAEISEELLGRINLDDTHNNTVLFYDNFGLINRGLAGIYINALLQLNYKVIWVLYEYGVEIEYIKDKFRHTNLVIEIIPRLDILSRMSYFQKVILQSAPKYLMIYTTPDDVAGIGTISTIYGNTTRYLIDLTDHAYWLGKCATDVVIGFRNVGYSVAVNLRGIEREKVVLLPYYPEERKEYIFEGLPFDHRKYKYVFSGGQGYKILGSDKWKIIVERILTENDAVKFVFASNDTNDILESLLEKFRGRFYLIKERKDLDEIIRNSRVYLSTYPIHGGLMEEYAVKNHRVPLCLIDAENPIEDVDYFLSSSKMRYRFFDVDSLCNEAKKIITDDEYFQKTILSTEGQLLDKHMFCDELSLLLNYGNTNIKGEIIECNPKNMQDFYKSKMTYDYFCEIIKKSRNKWVLNRHPEIFSE